MSPRQRPCERGADHALVGHNDQRIACAAPCRLGEPGAEPRLHRAGAFAAGRAEVEPPRFVRREALRVFGAQSIERPAFPCPPAHLHQPRLEDAVHGVQQGGRLHGPQQRAGDPARARQHRRQTPAGNGRAAAGREPHIGPALDSARFVPTGGAVADEGEPRHEPRPSARARASLSARRKVAAAPSSPCRRTMRAAAARPIARRRGASATSSTTASAKAMSS